MYVFMCVCVQRSKMSAKVKDRAEAEMDASSDGCTCEGSKRTLPACSPPPPPCATPTTSSSSSSISCHAPYVGQWQNVDFNVAVA